MTALSQWWTHTLGFGSSQLVLIGALVVLVLWLSAFLILVCYVASEKGRSGLAWGFAAIVFSPFVALIALAALPDRLGPVAVTIESPEGDEDVPEFKWRKGAD